MNGLDELRGNGRMTWIEAEQGWVASPDEIVKALSSDGFAECQREVTTGRPDSRPAGGVWQGVNMATGAVASASWVNRPPWSQATVFIAVDGEPLRGDTSSPAPDPHREDGGEA